ncbi:MAG: cell division protein FtsL [Bacillota bacterium]
MVMADEACTGRWVGYGRPRGRAVRAGCAIPQFRRGVRAATSLTRRAARARCATPLVRRAARARAVGRALGSVWVLGPALVGLVGLLALALVYLHVACLDTGHRILALQKEVQALQAENERLQLGVLRLSSPARVEQVAREKLGMVPVEVARTIPAPASVLAEAAEPRVTASWLEQVFSFLAGLLQGQGVLAGPAR